MNKKPLLRFVWVALLALSSALPLRYSHADEALARLVEAAAGRFFVGESVEGSRIAERILSRPMASQADYEELLSRIRSNHVRPEDAQIIHDRVRDLNERLTGDVESASPENLRGRVSGIAAELGIELRVGAEGHVEFIPARASEGTFSSHVAQFIEGGHVGRTQLARFEFDVHAAIPEADRAAVRALAERYGVESFHGANYAELVEQVFGKLRLGAAVSKEAAFEAADKLARMGEELEPMIASLSKEAQRGVRYTVADGVLTLEAFKASDFAVRADHPLVAKRVGYVNAQDYPQYVEGFVHNSAPYSTHPFSQGSGILSIQDMRDIASHNMWPLELRPHDFRHVHYALSHPRALAVYFKSARSMDPLRFTLVSAMYEGVDTVQYGHESSLARYMDTQMHMDLEEAMIHLGKASRPELQRIMQAAGIEGSVSSFQNQIANWTPTYAAPYSPLGRSGHGLDADLDGVIKQFLDYAKESSHAPYLQYNRNALAGQPPLQADNSIQHY